MSQTRIVNKNVLRTRSMIVMLGAIGVVGCSAINIPGTGKRIAVADNMLSANHPQFHKRFYAGASLGGSTLKPDVSNTVFTVADGNDKGSQLRIGVDLTDKLSVEVDTSVLGTATLKQAGTDVSYTSATVSGLFYGLTGAGKRARKTGWSAYGRLGYSVVQRASAVVPLDYGDNNVVAGLGAEYGFTNGLALRAEMTRIGKDATLLGLGGVYRFGMPPSQIGQVFVNAARPALGGTPVTRTAQNTNNDTATTNPDGMVYTTFSSDPWMPSVSENDIDGDGVSNSDDACRNTASPTVVGKNGCGLFDAILSDVTFRSGSDWLTPTARGELEALSYTLLAFPESQVQVRAHTDSRGTLDENLELSYRRANAVTKYLQELGVSHQQLQPLGLGESMPLAENDSKQGRERNRRVELLTLPGESAMPIDAPSIAAAKPALFDIQPIDETVQDVAQIGEVVIVEEQSMAKTDELSAYSAKVKQSVASADAKAVIAVVNALDGTNVELAAAMPASEAGKAVTETSAQLIKPTSKNDQPLFPAMSGVKIEPMPESVYVPGATIGGPVEGLRFEPKSVNLTANHKAALAAVADEMNRFPSIRVAVMAHTDEQVDDPSDKALTMRQSVAVIDHLISMGIDASRMEAEGYGSTLPVVQAVTDRDRERNRRIELRILD